MKYRLFVDESCHLEHDSISVMCIGYIKVPDMVYDPLKDKLHAIKIAHRSPMELKWNKFSASRLPMYKNLVDIFMDSPLEFRCVLVKYKERLNHQDFNQGSHDNFYYKMIYYLLRPNPVGLNYRVFIDIKDTRGKEKLNKIEEVFENYHHGKSPFIQFQHIRSHESVFIQLADFFIGAITYKSRVVKNEFKGHPAKLEFIDYLEEKTGFLMHEGTPPWEHKFNIFDHQPQKRS
jgi:hypothetical protein